MSSHTIANFDPIFDDNTATHWGQWTATAIPILYYIRVLQIQKPFSKQPCDLWRYLSKPAKVAWFEHEMADLPVPSVGLI